MAISIGSNSASLRAQRAVAEGSDALSRVFERLSSGQRINRASDDSAGLAVATSLRTKARVFGRGIQNINDGISALSIADSNLEILGGVVTRLVELAEQAANGSYSAKQRKALDSEAQALRAEFFRIARTTKFNDLNLFDGSVQGLRLQAGFGTDGSVASSLGGKLGAGTVGSANLVTLASTSQNYELADLNGDGIKDLISALASANSIGVQLGRGDGTFSSNTSYAAGTGAYALSVGDVNGDGTLDVVTANGSTTSISVHIGRGDGTFAASTQFTTAANPSSIKLADFNGDGKLDAVTAHSGAGAVNVMLGQGNGNFGSATSYLTGSFSFSTDVGDLNGDGNIDIVAANAGSNNISVLMGKGDGSFSAATNYANFSFGGRIELGDLNGDGALDILNTDYIGSGVSVSLNRGDGTFGTSSQVTTGLFTSKLGDMNGDGILDLVGSNSGLASISIRLGKGNGTFDSASTFTLTDVSGALTVGDIDGDGVLDVLVGATTNANSVLSNTRDGINPILSFSLATQADALQALTPLRNKLDALTAQRGSVGAFQARLQSALNTLAGQTDEIRAADSRIRDGDMAKESADLVRLQILQQSGAAVLGQANQQPWLALQLLQF